MASSSSSSCSALDALLELVDPPLDPPLLAGVAGGDVGAGQQVQSLQQVAGVADVAAHRGVGPAQLVGVEPQVQLDQLGDRRWSSPCRTSAPSCGPWSAATPPSRGGGRSRCRRRGSGACRACRCRAAAPPAAGRGREPGLASSWRSSSAIAFSMTARVCSQTSLWRCCGSTQARRASSSGSTQGARSASVSSTSPRRGRRAEHQLAQLLADALGGDRVQLVAPSRVPRRTSPRRARPRAARRSAPAAASAAGRRRTTRAGSIGVRRTRFCRSDRPPKRSTNSKAGTRTAIALTVKSRRARSPASVSP